MSSDQAARARRIGWFLIAAGLLLNEWVVGWLLTSDGRIDDMVVRVLVWTLDVLAVVSGTVLVRRRTLPARRTVLLSALTVVISILIVEVVLHVTFSLLGDDEPIDNRLTLSPYADKEWAEGLFRELGTEGIERHFEYHPYLGWDMKPFHGKWVKTDERGVRQTWAPPDLPGDAPTLYMFGGSTIWGMGARDDHTIPSYMAQELHTRGYRVAVHNYGDLAYSFTQELIHLFLLLKEGHRPNYVVFYDGINDVYGAYQAGRAGAPIDPFRNAARISEKYSPADHIKIGVQQLLKEHSMIYRALAGIPALFSSAEAFPEPGARMSDEELRALATGIVDYYLTSREILRYLAEAYDFEYMTFWQPVSLTEKGLRDEERNDPRTGDVTLKKLHIFALEQLTAEPLERFRDLSDVLADRNETYYVDYAHLSEAGNAQVARRMADIFEETFLK